MDSIYHVWFGFDSKNLIESRSQCWIWVDLELDGSDPVIGTKWELIPLALVLSLQKTKIELMF
jgi:hypothetical protein